MKGTILSVKPPELVQRIAFLLDPRFDEKQPPGLILPAKDECIYLDPKRLSNFWSASRSVFGA